MYFAIFVDDYLSNINNYIFKTLGYVYKSVIVECDNVPDGYDYIQLEQHEADAWRFVDVTAEEITVRPGELYEKLKHGNIRQVQAVNKLGVPLDNVVKYKYTLSNEDRQNAESLKSKIAKYINV